MASAREKSDGAERQKGLTKPLIILTLNTWKGDGAYSARLQSMTDEFRRLAPDILMLQECFAAPSLGLDTVATLADASGFHAATWLGREKMRVCEGRDAVSTSGLAVLSRHPIISSRAVELPSDPRDGERAALMVEIDHPDGLILAVSLHLTHLGDARALRRHQFDCLIAELARSSVKARVIVGGDFNSTPDEGFMEANLPNGRLVDSRILAGTAPASTLVSGDACIDHVLLLVPREGDGGLKVMSVSNVFDRPNPTTGILASDHFGVRVLVA